MTGVNEKVSEKVTFTMKYLDESDEISISLSDYLAKGEIYQDKMKEVHDYYLGIVSLSCAVQRLTVRSTKLYKKFCHDISITRSMVIGELKYTWPENSITTDCDALKGKIFDIWYDSLTQAVKKHRDKSDAKTN